MAVTLKWYPNGIKNLIGAGNNLAADTIKVGLVTSSYTPSQSGDAFWSTPVANEVTGTGYTAGGATLGSVTVTSSSLVVTFDAADTSWSTSTITAAYAIIYDSTPATNATRPLICYVDFGGNVSSTGGTFQITWNASGIATVTAS